MFEKKESNPKAVYGDSKVGLSFLPFGPVYEIATAMIEGSLKYGKHNYRDMGCKASTYFDAAIGHLVSWYEGEDTDEESGVPHLMKAAACLIVLRDSQLMGNDTDDRPIKYPKGVPLRKNPLIQKLLDKYPNPVKPFTEKNQYADIPHWLDGPFQTYNGPVKSNVKLNMKAIAASMNGYAGPEHRIEERRKHLKNYKACLFCTKVSTCEYSTTRPAKRCKSYEDHREQDRRKVRSK